ncbi:hypothetical protein [Parasphingorhabdus halotolerans]|uniref:DUF4136 domain-containing protein n=1 Tax=Parasphingorhabdus halotolerans TaxID=2725558 RepID=A0A6H2DNV3_9SPHN|nr:hypothetical protein [Parasphingorhabdus halotolerans]QJB70339.1 hypothetical protein HF685_14555 [Parasphingorhabdus halotolerans]
MTRLSFFLPLCLVTLSACAGPIETRIETRASASGSVPKQFMFSENLEQNNQTYSLAKSLVSQKLLNEGYSEAKVASLLVQIALADRPASIAISTGEQPGKTLVGPKKNKPLQSCLDQEHRFSVDIFNQIDGSIFYSGKAAEYHCKGTMDTSLPHLVDAALSDLGANNGLEPKSSTRSRTGVE